MQSSQERTATRQQDEEQQQHASRIKLSDIATSEQIRAMERAVRVALEILRGEGR